MTLDRRRWIQVAAAAAAAKALGAQDLRAGRPCVLLTPELVREMAEKAAGPFASEYRTMLETARLGPRNLDSQWNVPGAFMEAGIAWLVERELGRDGRPFAEQVLSIWRRPEWQRPGLRRHFGWQGLLYDWLYDAMTEGERARYGELLGEWVATWWKTPEVNIDKAGWWYNQHWGPEHLDEPHNRVALTSKLFMSAASRGHAGRFEEAVARNLASFRERYLADGIPALEEMGGIWSESVGHGGYGPLMTVPFGAEAARTALGIDAFASSGPHGFFREYIRAAVYGLMPHNMKQAWIDDSGSGYPVQQARCAPLFARHYRDGVARWLSDTALARGWLRNRNTVPQDELWQRIAWLPADLEPASPGQAGWPLARHFRGAGHVYMLGAWDDPNATWAFFGAGPSYAGHSRDDEGHFLVCRRGQLVNRAGGNSPNDHCYYAGGSLAYNIVTVYHPGEQMRRAQYNENDGGLMRWVYSQRFPVERGHIKAYWHDDKLGTYAAADLTAGYWPEKVREVTRQFVYLRGEAECFVICDRVEAAAAELPKVWFLHLPSEPELNESGDRAAWKGDMAGDTGALSEGAGRALLQTLAPAPAKMVKRGGPGQDFWGHPHNPEAQYNHTLDRNGKEHPSYRRPPYSPWRLEVEPSERRARDLFLHVLFVGDEGGPEFGVAERVEAEGRLGARIPLGRRTATVWFDLEGPPGCRLTVEEAGAALYDGELPREMPAE
jgi:hypothetical protein